MCLPGSSGRATSSSVQRTSAATSGAGMKPRASSHPCRRYVATCSRVNTGSGEVDGSVAPGSPVVMSSISRLLKPGQDLLSRARDIGIEIDLGPREIADVLDPEVVGMREDEIADGGLVLCAGALVLDIGHR